MNFNEETSGIVDLDVKSVCWESEKHGWFTLDGCRLNGKPTECGIYIHNGKKVVVRQGFVNESEKEVLK